MNTEDPNLKHMSRDEWWDYGELINQNDVDNKKCNLCGHKFGGVALRLKQHTLRTEGTILILFGG